MSDPTTDNAPKLTIQRGELADLAAIKRKFKRRVDCTAFTVRDEAGDLIGAVVVATLGDVGTVLQIEGTADVQERLVKHAIRALGIDTLAIPPAASEIDLEPTF